MELTKKELQDLYNSMTNEELCKKLDVSKPTLIKYLTDLEIPMKGKGYKKKLVIKGLKKA